MPKYIGDSPLLPLAFLTDKSGEIIWSGEAAYLGVGNMQPFKTTLKFMFKVPPLKQWAAERAVDERAKAALAAADIRLPAYQAGVWVEK